MEQQFQATVQQQGSRIFIELPFDPNQVWGEKARHDVHGMINEARIRGKLAENNEGYLLSLGPAWRRDSGIEAGTVVTVSLEAEGPQIATLANDLQVAFADAPEAVTFFNALPTHYRKNYIRWVESAKRAETRVNRIVELIELLGEGKRER